MNENEKPIPEKKTRTRTAKPTIDPTALSHVPTKRDFGIIAKMFEDEPKTTQDMLIAVSSKLQLIKLNLSEQPVVISYLVRKNYVGASEQDIFDMLKTGLAELRLIDKYPGETLSELLTSVANHNHSDETTNPLWQSDTQWNIFWDGMFKAISAPYCDWIKLMSYAPYVYSVG